MKNKKLYFLILFIVLILVYIFFSMTSVSFKENVMMDYLFLGLIILIGLYLIFSKDSLNDLKTKNQLFNSIVENSHSVYIMINSKTKKAMYVSKNIEEVLGIRVSEKLEDVVFKILNIPVIKSELNNWDMVSEYVGQMIEYDNPKYNHQMWIKVKIFPFKDREEEYYVIQILDATKDHDRQHLLISQATDIKAREVKLNHITASSYDFEMNINLVTNSYDLKYFKLDNLYFGEEKRGNYKEGLKEILSYINEHDKELFYSTLSLENLKERFAKYELDSIQIRYRLGNEVKNNTWLESTIFFLSNRNKNTVSVLTKNVTENAESIREQNVMLQNALNEAKIADKAKTDLISTISHEVRTPLTSIMGLSESLLNKKLNNDVKEDIENINTSSHDLLDIIDNLLDPSKVGKKEIKKNEKQYSILEMFKKLEKTTKEYIGNKPVEVNLILDSNLPVVLYGDDKRISSSLTKILNNSVKFTNEGNIDIHVRGEKKNSNVKLIVEVSDTGIGMDNNKIKEIINSKDDTTGFGNVKNLMEILGGTLEIESKVGEYTKVTVTFIQKIVEDNKVREMMNNNKKAEEFSLKGRKVLIVDDNKLNLKVTKRLLEPYELDVTLLESGEECIDLVNEQNNFDLIMLDQMMPGLDGITTLNKLREINSFNTPIVVLTADAMEGQKEKYLSSGFDDYISKPIDKSELSRVLKKFLKNHE
ncbi:MAG: response regulator [Bacilli bacterium]|nr:response regulator [Bacilli bacterium]